MKPERYIIGVDPGLANCGLCRLDPAGRALTRIVRTKPSDGSFLQRARIVVVAVADMLEPLLRHNAWLAIEEQSKVRRGREEQGRSSHSAHSAEHMQMVIIGWAFANGISVCSVTPGEIKQGLTGSSRATKHQVIASAQSRLHYDTGAYMPAITDHEADALGAALHCEKWLKLPEPLRESLRRSSGRAKAGRASRSRRARSSSPSRRG